MTDSRSSRGDSLLAGNLTFGPLLIMIQQLVVLVLATVGWLFRSTHKRPLPPSPACMITGCDSGIGKETALKLAAEASACVGPAEEMQT